MIATRALHASDLTSWQRCGFRYKMERDDEIKPTFRHPSALMGTVVHRLIEEIEARKHSSLSREIVETYFQEEIENPKREDERGVPVLWPQNGAAEKKRESLLDDAFDMVVGYTIDPRNKANILALEHEWACDIIGRPFTGRIDQVRLLEDGTVQILDLKSGATKPGETFLTLWPQAHVYALAAARGELFEGRTVSKVTWLHLRDYIPYKINSPSKGIVKGQPRGPVFYDVPITPRSIASMELELSRFIEALDVGRFERRPTSENCASCPYAGVCLADFIGGPVPETKMEVSDEDFE